MIHAGGCHCGNLRFALETSLGLTALPLRACQCTFCRRHGALSTSDPQGRVSFQVRDAGRVIRYRFGLRTADFLICAGCGVYVGARIESDGRRFAIVNANTLDEAGRLTQATTPMSYDGEDALQRERRRTARWTPLDP